MIQRGDILLDKYKVEHVLGEGGMGTVLAARHIELDEMFAIKLMRTGTTQSETMISRFVREARAAARLRSLHVARVHDVGKLAGGEPYMVMEYLHGCDLREFLTHQGPLPYEHACLLMRQACEGIAEAHALGIIHRDLKLENLFLTHLRDGRPCLKILDFGISKYANESRELTTPGALLGSLRYMSPEQMRNAKTVDPRADVWAMGAIFYELLTNCPAFAGNNITAIIDNVVASTPQPLSELCPNVPAELESAILRCLSKQPERRYQTINELASVLANALPQNPSWPNVYSERANMLADQPAAERQQSQKISSVRKALSSKDPTVDAEEEKGHAEAFGTTHNVKTTITTSSGKPRVCISCRSDTQMDVELAEAFAAALAFLGVVTFVPSRGGEQDAQTWIERVTEAIHACDLFVVVLSEQAVVSELLASQFALAHELNAKASGRPQLLGIRLNGVGKSGELPALASALDDLSYVEWNGSDDTLTVMNAILTRLRLEVPADRKANLARWAHDQKGSAASVRARDIPLEQPGGIVRGSSPYYVSNPKVERRCQEELRKPGALVRIRSPRRMGKTSLIMRLLEDTERAGMRVAHVDLQLADSNILSDLDRFLRWICAVISRRLSLPRANTEWDDVFGPKDNCTAYFEDQFFGSGRPLVLALKNIDRLFGVHEVAEEFLVLLRAWHEMTKSHSKWQELRMILSYSTEMYMPLDVNHSPFNVGLGVSLADWNSQTVLELAHRHGLTWGTDEVAKLMHLIGGHPHLVRIALHHLAETGANLDDVLAHAVSDEGLFADHMKPLLWHLKRQPALAQAAIQVMQAQNPIRLPTELAFKLVSLGVVQLHGDLVSPGRELYRRYLSTRLGMEGG